MPRGTRVAALNSEYEEETGEGGEVYSSSVLSEADRKSKLA